MSEKTLSLDELSALAAALSKISDATVAVFDFDGEFLAKYPVQDAQDATLTDSKRRRLVKRLACADKTTEITVEDELIILIFSYGTYWLVVDNAGKVQNQRRYLEGFEQSLQYIAQVAGGDAVLFNRNGVRIKAYSFDGTPNPEALGVANNLCLKVMKELRPSIGPSVMVHGATAVRLPLTPDIGLAFNNRQAAIQRQKLINSARHYNYAKYNIEDIVGEGPAITRAKNLAREAAKTYSTVLITGETGTGKELFAQAIHNMHIRAAKPFVAINCGALPANLVESILFGYTEGAFTGAKRGGQAGAFEQACGGTLFLDEISEMPLDIQVKLLRVIQEREVTRVGDNKAIPVDVRLIASTNKSLLDMIKTGTFRADLYFRLNVFELEIPPLRQRKEDLLALTDFFLQKFAAIMGKKVHEITPCAMEALYAYDWPGNIRELQNVLEYAFNIVSKDGESISIEHLPPNIARVLEKKAKQPYSYDEYMREAERAFILKALQECGYNKAETARRIGINRTSLWRILSRHGLLNSTVAKANNRVANPNT